MSGNLEVGDYVRARLLPDGSRAFQGIAEVIGTREDSHRVWIRLVGEDPYVEMLVLQAAAEKVQFFRVGDLVVRSDLNDVNEYFRVLATSPAFPNHFWLVSTKEGSLPFSSFKDNYRKVPPGVQS